MCARRAEPRADFVFERMRVALGAVQRCEDARDASGSRRLDEREIFVGRVVEAGIERDSILENITPFPKEKAGRLTKPPM